jgi:hypothetical protein
VIVDFEYYGNIYMGTEADAASFPALCARAEDVVGAMVKWRDPDKFTPFQMTLYKKAICAQVDFFAVNGLDAVAGGTDRGFTVGKVSVSGKSGSDLVRKGGMTDSLSPLVVMYLEQSGLMAPQVNTAPDMPLVGWWV